jgi:hypothetical protein
MGSEYLFSINKINRLRKKAQKTSQIKVSNFEFQGWSESNFDARTLLDVFKPLKLQVGITLKAYLFRSGSNGNGIIRAIQSMEDEQEGDTITNDDLFVPPLPRGAMDTVMEGIEGDGSPWSYMCASLFAREAEEFGALWHGVSWETHYVVSPDFSDDAIITLDYIDLEWKKKPSNFTPKVTYVEESVVVTFYTFSGLGISGVYEHVDTYRKGTYVFESINEKIAEGGIGYIF